MAKRMAHKLQHRGPDLLLRSLRLRRLTTDSLNSKGQAADVVKRLQNKSVPDT